MAAQTSFRPFVPASESPKELSARALILGGIFGVLFGAVTVYVGLRAGLTVAASIPISVLSISILRVFGRGTILENNIVQTTGNAGQSIASGVIFTLPALIFLGFDLESFRIFALALFGGWLGVLFMIPLRRQLIVDEHDTLVYPEGTACAEVLKAGERGGSFASRVFLGLGIGGLYTLFQNENLTRLFPATPNWAPNFDPNGQQILKGAAIRADVTPEYMGVGYIIGIRVAAIMLAGGVFSWLVLMPAIVFFGKHLTGPLYPGTVPISQMDPSSLWRTYVRPMGAGAVAASGLITLLRTAPTIISALTSGFAKIGKGKAVVDEKISRIEHDMPMSVVVGGSLLLVLFMVAFLVLKPIPGAQVSLLANFAAAILVVIFGFLFVTVSARIVGIVGSSASPVSGMTIATLMATAAIFLVKGWTAPAFGALAITIGGMVCIAASNAGDTSQDLKTGYLIGATPWKQQLAVMIGVVISTLAIGTTMNLMNKGMESFQPMAQQKSISLAALPEGVQNQGVFTRNSIKLKAKAPGAAEATVVGQIDDAQKFVLLNSIGSPVLEDGKYLYNPSTGKIEVQWIQGIGSERAAAPQGRLMATVINGILSRKLPWGLVLLGVALVIGIELLGVRSLTFAVGAYLSIGTTLAIFCGGVVRWLVDQAALRAGNAAKTEVETEVSSGSLFASGLIASGGIMGLLGVATQALNKTFPFFPESNPLHKDWVSVLCFGMLGFSLYYFARKPIPSEAVLEDVEREG
jgi:putative OPT family oligopeptide transporter